MVQLIGVDLLVGEISWSAYIGRRNSDFLKSTSTVLADIPSRHIRVYGVRLLIESVLCLASYEYALTRRSRCDIEENKETYNISYSDCTT